MSWQNTIRKMSDVEKMNLIIRLLEGEIEMLEDIDTSLKKTNSEYTDEIISLIPQSKTPTQNQNSETEKDNIECASSNLIKSIELNF